ncbi:glycosyltransferase family 4 protein [Cyclobacterium jeungdonense]|uniref:Glycosyltransferase family 4 protein n=1 Tax=Cyclobacterium jeungdonense TaxID=708087 RepID=A0ABT8C804_9BACT|nr:glycosyltransferase family 4 protein [Cyclobacterium jeungdonense]MDN3688894.1 glycosyltransferase family 4 protein [Cyclobacterium jeungdonense]
MKILFITNMYPTSNHPADGIFIKDQIEDVQKEMDLEADIYLIDGVHHGKLEYLKSIFSIPIKLATNNYDATHIHYGISGIFLLFFKPKIKKFMTLHGCDIQDWGSNSWHVWITKKILNKVDLVFVQNQKMKKVVGNINPNVEILPCGANPSFFSPQANIKKNGRRDFVILFPGSSKREVKNFPLFLEVMDSLRKLGVHNIRHQCLENMSREQVRDAMLNSDCLLMTSISEGSPQVVKEALYCNLPVVSVPVGDVREMLHGLPNCKVSDTYNKEELAQLVKSVLSEDYAPIRETFLKKKQYSIFYVAKRLAKWYTEPPDKDATLNLKQKTSTS